MGNVLCGVKISFKDQAHAHRVPSQGGCVDRGPQRVLKERGGKKGRISAIRTGGNEGLGE